MTNLNNFFSLMLFFMLTSFAACSQNTKVSEHQQAQSSTTNKEEYRGEHDRDRGGDLIGEESGTELALTDRYDQIRHGVRLMLAYDPGSNSFNGTVENTTKKTLERVRVEVHLSNGKELGPTKPDRLKPSEKRAITLKAMSQGFSAWSAHPEVGNNEHGHGEGHENEEKGEHGDRKEGKREHN